MNRKNNTYREKTMEKGIIRKIIRLLDTLIGLRDGKMQGEKYGKKAYKIHPVSKNQPGGKLSVPSNMGIEPGDYVRWEKHPSGVYLVIKVDPE